MMLTDVARSLEAHGFTDIVFIGDSGGNQRGMENVANALNARWTDSRAHFIPEFYDIEGTTTFMSGLGIEEGESDGFHDFYWITVQQMVTDPATVRYDERVEAGLAHINGVSIAPMEESVEVGRKILEWRAETTADAIRAAIAGD